MQGPFEEKQISEWFDAGFLPHDPAATDLAMRGSDMPADSYTPLSQMVKEGGGAPRFVTAHKGRLAYDEWKEKVAKEKEAARPNSHGGVSAAAQAAAQKAEKERAAAAEAEAIKSAALESAKREADEYKARELEKARLEVEEQRQRLAQEQAAVAQQQVRAAEDAQPQIPHSHPPPLVSPSHPPTGGDDAAAAARRPRRPT